MRGSLVWWIAIVAVFVAGGLLFVLMGRDARHAAEVDRLKREARPPREPREGPERPEPPTPKPPSPSPAPTPPPPEPSPARRGLHVSTRLGGPGPNGYIARGRITNDTPAKKTGIVVTVTFELPGGRKHATMQARSPTTLEPGAAGDFEAVFSGARHEDVSGFIVTVEGK